MRLVVVPDSDRVEQWLLDESRASEFVDLRGVCNFSQLVERCEPALFAKKNAADALVTQLMFAQAAAARPGPFGALATTPQFARQVCELVNELRANDAEPWQLAQAAAKCPRGLSERATAIAEMWRVADEALAAHQLVAAGEWTRLAAKRLEETQALPPALRGHERLEVRDLHDVPLARLRFLKALAKACDAAKVAFHWSWPAAGESNADAFIIETVRHAEAAWSQEELGLERAVADAPLAWISRELFTPTPTKQKAETLFAFVAPTAREELREIARRTRASISAGVPPESIAIVFRDLADDTEPLVESLAELGVPARARVGVPLGRSSAGRAALKLLELADDEFPADDVAAVLENPSVSLLHEEAAEPRRAFREAGIRDDALGAAANAGAYDLRLTSLAKRSGEDERSVKLLHEAVQALIARTSSPAEAPASELLDAWWDAVSKLGLLAPPRSFSQPRETELLRAESVANAASKALGELLNSLKTALRVSGAGNRVMRRADFARWVRDAAEEVNLDTHGARAGAVWLLEARELAGRHFAQVFVGGLVDGRWPGRATPAMLLSDEERVQLNRELGKPLFRVSVGENDVRLPARLAEDRLLFHFALSAGATVTLSRSRFDSAGREALASPFVDALRRCVEDFREEPIRRSVVAALDEVQSEEELRVRAALEALSPPVTRQTVPDARGMALAGALSSEAWFQEARASSEAETERLRFFSDEQQPAASFSGRLDAATLAQRLAFDVAHPLSAHEMQNWARCGFRGLAAHVIGLEASESAGEDLDARVRGNLWHDALAHAVPRLRDAKLLGRPSAELRKVVEESVARAAEKLEERAAVGHPALWSLAQDWASAVITRVLSVERTAKPFGALEPRLFEADFGAARAIPELREVKIDLDPPVFLHGRMDRVDTAPGSIGVVDYKTSISKTLSRDFLEVEFQMAFYLLAARQLEAGATITGAWVGIGRGEVQGLPRKSVNPIAELKDATEEVLTSLREGDFGPRPSLECGTCEFKSVCRISQRKLLDDVP